MKYQKKLLILDIETSPNIGVFWHCGQNQNITSEQVIKERQIISIAYKYYGEPKCTTKSIDWGLNQQNDRTAVMKIQEIITGADAVLGQNSDKFDLRWINGRLAYYGLPAIPDSTILMTLDTLKLARGALNLNSFKLNYMLRFFGLPEKIEMHFSDWLKVVCAKDKKVFKKMLAYNKNDVIVTELLFNKLLPYVKLPFKLSLVLGKTEDRGACPQCGSHDLVKDGVKIMPSGIKKQRFQCRDCGRRFR